MRNTNKMNIKKLLALRGKHSQAEIVDAIDIQQATYNKWKTD
jgi:ACT domain-containing protein